MVGLVMHQDGISEKECFWMCLVLILADSKSGAIRMPKDLFVCVCVEVLRPSQPNGVMSSAVSLPNHTFTGQA